MKIQDRINEMEKMIIEQEGQLAVTLPEHSAKELIRYCRDIAELKRKYNQEQIKANWYQEAYTSAKAQLKMKKEGIL